ncbi:Gfo/Idh/MocA family protein [Actinosynnema sp. CA-299493]
MALHAAALKVALLGTAHVHLADHLDALRRDGRVELVAAHHGDERWWTSLPGVPAVDLDEALALADAVIVASTTAGHARLLPGVVAAEVPALVEKPLGADDLATRSLAALVDVGRAPVTTAMFLRCAPALRRVRALLTERFCGELSSAHVRFTHPGGLFTGPAGWMLDRRWGAVGGFADLGVHLLDLLVWLCPDVPLRASSLTVRHVPDLALDVGGVALIDWGGVPVSVHAGWTSRPGGLHLHFEGAEGSLTVDGGRLLARRAGSGGEVSCHPGPAAGDAVTAFLAQLRGEPSWEMPTTAEIVTTSRVLAELGS